MTSVNLCPHLASEPKFLWRGAKLQPSWQAVRIRLTPLCPCGIPEVPLPSKQMEAGSIPAGDAYFFSTVKV